MRQGTDALAEAEKLLTQRRFPDAVDPLSPQVEQHLDDTPAWRVPPSALEQANTVSPPFRTGG